MISANDIINVDLDFEGNKIIFTSEKSNQIASGDLKPEITAVRFIAEFAFKDSRISFK